MAVTRAGAPDTPPMMGLALFVLAATALAPILYLALAPDFDPVPVYLAPAAGALAEAPGSAATPNHDPHRRSPALLAATISADAGPVEASVQPGSSFALEQAMLRAGPEPAANDLIAQQIVASQAVAPSTPAPTFTATDTPLYAKGNARLRAAPSTEVRRAVSAAGRLADRSTARSSDGAWWRVSLAGGRVAYVNQSAVTQTRPAKPQLATASTPVATNASRPVSAQPEWQRRSQEFFGYVDRSMNWLADQAGGGPAPKVVRSER